MQMLLSFVVIFFVSFFSLILLEQPIPEELSQVQKAQVIESRETAEPVRVVFVGDIMLGRHVENIISEKSVPYLFKNMETLLQSADLTVGNFEGIISREHTQTPWMGFRFSVRNKYVTELKMLGFDILSLANNHSYDFGEDALSYTRLICKEIKIHCIGDPREISELSTDIVSVNNTTVGFFALQTVTASYHEEDLLKAAAFLNAGSDIQIAYIHWGDEYVLTHDEAQEQLAHRLIDLGFDAVIGHHPHVVQDVELYNGKPIIYSLGNFIFDQYFDTHVQEGLVVEMKISDESVDYTLLPISSVETKDQPDFMNEADQISLLHRILPALENNDHSIDPKRGLLTITRE